MGFSEDVEEEFVVVVVVVGLGAGFGVEPKSSSNRRLDGFFGFSEDMEEAVVAGLEEGRSSSNKKLERFLGFSVVVAVVVGLGTVVVDCFQGSSSSKSRLFGIVTGCSTAGDAFGGLGFKKLFGEKSGLSVGVAACIMLFLFSAFGLEAGMGGEGLFWV